MAGRGVGRGQAWVQLPTLAALGQCLHLFEPPFLIISAGGYGSQVKREVPGTEQLLNKSQLSVLPRTASEPKWGFVVVVLFPLSLLPPPSPLPHRVA